MGAALLIALIVVFLLVAGENQSISSPGTEGRRHSVPHNDYVSMRSRATGRRLAFDAKSSSAKALNLPPNTTNVRWAYDPKSRLLWLASRPALFLYAGATDLSMH
ncbi:hypothetical protein PR002_g12004 [Phytophthora rubi]|uniref:RxLR effector protein n=1 Tax=Phytophthora rubi TaxID=129364 RepID=A0A6A3LW29_9STRA|nr:hypothetical protein PR002_g12004 [Phytophthora rubi]